MILGIGVDILNIQHFQKSVQKTPAIIQRLFTPKEQELAPKNKTKKIAYYAKRFAAKEAFSKACGTGIGENLTWKEIEIFNDAQGAPYFVLSKKTSLFINKKFKTKKYTPHLSLSDEDDAIAFVVLEK